MIGLPAGVALASASPSLIDFGGVLRPALGGEVLKVNRMGSRFRIAASLPPLPANEMGRICVSRLIQAKSEGLRIAYPLDGVDQGAPGAPVVNGAGQSGTTINLRGLTPSYVAREGFWLSIQNAAGRHHLHIVRTEAIATSGGLLVLPIAPMLRVPFADGALVHLAVPMIEGLIDGEEFAWQTSLARYHGIEFTLEEAA